MFRLSDGKRVAACPQYADIKSILGLNDFIALGMIDRRIISYMIVDKEENVEKLKKLESRFVKNVSYIISFNFLFTLRNKDQNSASTKTKITKFVNKLDNMLDASSDEEFDDFDIFVKEDTESDVKSDDSDDKMLKLKELRKGIQIKILII